MRLQFQPVFEFQGDYSRIHALQAICGVRTSAADDRLCILGALREIAMRPRSMKVVIPVRSSTMASDSEVVPFLEWSARAHEIDHDRIIVAVGHPSGGAMPALRESGFRVALDEVGSAYANVLVALQLRPDYIKVERSLIAGIGSDPSRMSVLHAIRDLASGIGALVIAEGVDSAEELAAVRGAGIDCMSGALLAPPREGFIGGDESDSTP